jgi:hypothetical protein
LKAAGFATRGPFAAGRQIDKLLQDFNATCMKHALALPLAGACPTSMRTKKRGCSREQPRIFQPNVG